MEAEVPSNRLWKNFFGSSDARIFPIEMILDECDNRMCFDRERRIVLSEANFVTYVDRQRAFHGYCPMDEHIVPQRARHRAASLSYDECGEGVHDEVPARDEFPVSGSQGCSRKERRRDGRVDMQDAVPAQILRRVPWCAWCLSEREWRRGRRRTGAGGHIQ